MLPQESKLIILLAVTSIVILLLGMLLVFLFSYYQRRQLFLANSVATLKLEYDKNILSAKVEMQENTFQHISREIHDNINLSLTLAKLHLNTIDLRDTKTFESKVLSSVDLISQTIEDLRDLSKSLQNELINNLGLIAGLKNEIEKIEKTGLLNFTLTTKNEPVFLETEREIVIFRIIQEAFNNIIKHAKATRVEITLNYHLNDLLVIICDDGIGMETPPKAANNETSGIRNMTLRAGALGGNMKIESILNKGTSVAVTIPYT